MFQLRLIQAQDNAQMAQIIRKVSEEFGLNASSGFAVGDSVVDHLYETYQATHSRYWVVSDEHGKIYGGGGASPLHGDESLMEVQKMYFLDEIRGFGYAKSILVNIFDFATEEGFKSCYLETTQTLWQAIKLYEKLGFQHLDEPRGATGHSEACEVWMLKNLK